MAKIEPVEISCKDGRTARLRTPVAADAARVLAYGKVNIEDGVGSLTTPEEFTLTIEEEAKWLGDHLEHPDDLVIVAEAGEAMIGLLNFKAMRRRRLAHHGSLGMSVHPDWRSQGVGFALLSKLLEWARANPRLTCVRLQVIADNELALGLYRKLGFVEEGRRVQFINYGDRVVDDILMYVMV